MRKKDALELLEREGCSEDVIRHVQTVSVHAVRIARRMNENAGNIDEHAVKIGALLHDIGRCETNSVFHGIEGAKILERYNVDPIYIRVCKNHLGAGIDKKEAEKLGLPRGNYLPQTKEEKLIAYVDNLVMDSKIVSFEQALEHFKDRIDNEKSIKRFLKMHQEFGGYV